VALPLKYNLRNLWVRRVSTLMTIAGIALVVTVFVIVSSLAHGLIASYTRTGDSLTLLVKRQGATSELESFITRESYEILRNLDGVAHSEGEALASGEHFILMVAPRVDGGETNLTVRGVGPMAFRLRPYVRIVEGRAFQPGLNELVVSRNISGRFQNSRVGDRLELAKRSFQVVGVFETGGTAYDSEVWGDADVIGETFRRRGGYSTVRLRTSDERAMAALKTTIETDRRLQFEPLSEVAYYDAQTSTAQPILIIGVVVSVFLGVGAVFGAMNTLYAAVASRVREIATLRALGFSRFAVVTAFLIEALALAAVGGAAGCLLALPFHGVATGTVNWVTFSEAAFAFEITPVLMGFGLVFALAMGLVGGLPPAFNAARRPVASALREL
jgi:putative ABC transport system permease protein